MEEWREDGVRAVGRLIEITGVLETVARRQCVMQDNNGSFEFVRSEKVAETLSGGHRVCTVSVVESVK